MAGYPVVGVSASCTHDPQGVDIYDEEGNLTHYDLGDTVPLSKLISRRYSWLVNRGYLSETEVGFGGGGGAGTWGSITGTLSSQTDLQTALNAKAPLAGPTFTGTVSLPSTTSIGSVSSTELGYIAGVTSSIQTQLNLMLPLTGGTLTGSLTLPGTAGTKNLSMSSGYAILGLVTIGHSGSGYGTIGDGYRTTSTAHSYNYDRNDYATMIDFANGSIKFKTAGIGTVGNPITYSTPMTIANNGAVTLTGDLTVSKATPVLSLTGSGSGYLHVNSTDNHSTLYLDSPAELGSARIRLRTGANTRWELRKNYTAESGSNAGSNFELMAYDDAGTPLSTPLTITRSTGSFTLTGDVTISKASPQLLLNATSGSPSVNISGVAGTFRGLQFKTAGSRRWTMYANADAESGSDVGSDFAMYRANDAGSETRVMYVQRSTGNVTFDNAVSAASLTATGTNGITVNGGLTYLQPGTNASNALWVRGKASQSSALVLFQDSAGTTLSSISATGTFSGPASLTTVDLSGVADTATAATHYYVETATDGLVRPKTLADVKTEIVTTAAVNSAAATTVGTVTGGTWQGTVIADSYIDSAIARLASPALTGTPTAPTAAVDTNTTQVATTQYVVGQGYLKSATASSTYAPLASPSFTGTVTTPGVKRNLATKSALYTLTASDHIIVATTGTWNATLPTAASAAGTEYIIKNSGSGTITVNTTSSQTIDGSLSIDLAQYDSLTVVSDGSNWVIL